MPLYQYYCRSCEAVYEINHTMAENLEDTLCTECSTGMLERLLSQICKTPSEQKFQIKTGDVVKAFIKDSTGDLKEQKKKMKERTR